MTEAIPMPLPSAHIQAKAFVMVPLGSFCHTTSAQTHTVPLGCYRKIGLTKNPGLDFLRLVFPPGSLVTGSLLQSEPVRRVLNHLT